MKKIREHVIKSIEPGSIAEELELEPGDVLVEVNGQPVRDVFWRSWYGSPMEKNGNWRSKRNMKTIWVSSSRTV